MSARNRIADNGKKRANASPYASSAETDTNAHRLGMECLVNNETITAIKNGRSEIDTASNTPIAGAIVGSLEMVFVMAFWR